MIEQKKQGDGSVSSRQSLEGFLGNTKDYCALPEDGSRPSKEPTVRLATTKRNLDVSKRYDIQGLPEVHTFWSYEQAFKRAYRGDYDPATDGVLSIETLALVNHDGEFKIVDHSEDVFEGMGEAECKMANERPLWQTLAQYYAGKRISIMGHDPGEDRGSGMSMTFQGLWLQDKDTYEGEELFVKGIRETRSDRTKMINEGVIQQIVSDRTSVGRVTHLAEIYLPNGQRVSTMAMGMVDGESLEMIYEDGLDVEQKLNVLTQIAEQIQYLGAQGIAHRDIKPGNVLVKKEGDDVKATLIDMGIADFVKKTDPREVHQYPNVYCEGTLRYMSPEQMLGHPAGLQSSTDVFSFASMAYELLTGATPATEAVRRYHVIHHDINKCQTEILSDIAKETYDSDERVENGLGKMPALRNLLYRATKNDADERPTMDEMVLGMKVAYRRARWARKMRDWGEKITFGMYKRNPERKEPGKEQHAQDRI